MSGVCAVMLVKDEADIIERTIRHLLTQVDCIIFADNMSTDGTAEIVWGIHEEERLPGNASMVYIDDDDPGYRQAAKTTDLAHKARQMGFDWVVPCDADEIWYSAFGRLADVIMRHDADFDVLTAEMYDHVATVTDRRDDLNPLSRIGWRRKERGRLPKVAARLTPDLRIDMGNHGVTVSYEPRVREWALSIRHYPYRSPEQFVRKAVNGAKAYAAAPDVSTRFGGHWRAYGKMIADHGDEAGYEWFHKWFYSDNPPLPPAGARDEGAPLLVFDPFVPETP